jgi:hypothetical protein
MKKKKKKKVKKNPMNEHQIEESVEEEDEWNLGNYKPKRNYEVPPAERVPGMVRPNEAREQKSNVQNVNEFLMQRV